MWLHTGENARGSVAGTGRAGTPQLTNVNKLGAHHTVWSHEGVVRGITAGMDLAAESGYVGVYCAFRRVQSLF